MGDGPLAWHSYVIGSKSRVRRFVQLPDALPSSLPVIAFWNCSSLCASDVDVAAARLTHVRCLLKTADVTILCEVHPRDDWVQDLGLEGFATWISKDPRNSGGAGGVLVVMSRRYARMHRALVIPIWNGRMVQVRLEMGACVLNVLGVHVTPLPSVASWE